MSGLTDLIQKIKKEKEQFKLSDPPSVQVQCDNDPDNERDPGEGGDQVVSTRDPMLSSISPDNTKMWRSLSSESMDDTESLVYYKVGVTTHQSDPDPCVLRPGSPNIRRRSLARLASAAAPKGQCCLTCASLRRRGFPWSPDPSLRGQSGCRECDRSSR